MGANLPYLPDELLLSIASKVPCLQEFSLVSKQLCRIGASMAVQRTRDDPSHMIISEAIKTLRWLNIWAQTQNLVEELCNNVQNRFVRDVHGRKMNDALNTLRLLDRLPQNAVIPEYDFLVIMDTVSRWVFLNSNTELRDWFFPITALVLLSRLSSPARIPQEQFFDHVRAIQGQIVQDINNGRHHFSSIMLRDLTSLTWQVEMPDGGFFDILEANRNSAIYFIHDGQLETAKATLQVLRHFPADIRIPPDFFFAVVETIRDRLKRTIVDDLHSTMKLLCILDAIPSTTKVPNEYFIDVVTSLSSLLPSAIEKGVGHDAKKILLMLHRLPASRTLLKPDFPQLEETIRCQITRDMSYGRVRRATRMAEVLRILSSIEEY